ncbi:MAG: holin family protein [Rickettsiales bacterium]|nr:holin family protein [Rickettsiales bacterium]
MSFIPFLDVGMKMIDKIFPDPAEKARAQALLIEKEKEGELQEIEASMKVIVAEARGSYLQRNWRPITMLVFVAIIANNYILYPYLSLFWRDAPVLELAPEMWDVLKIGIGGYIAGRSVEKSISNWKG